MNNEVLKEDVQSFADHFELKEQLSSKTFLITGATGLIGSVMIKCLLALNQKFDLDIKILALVRDLEKARRILAEEFDSIKFLQLPLTAITTESVGTLVDFIVHLASPTASKFFVEHPVETLTTSIDGTHAILEYAKAAKIEAMVFASSLEVYGSNETDELITEDFQGYLNPTEVRSSYNMGKRTAECLCNAYAKEHGIPVKIARLTQTTGAGIAETDNRVIVQFTRLASEGKDIVLHTTGQAARPYLYTTDAISALLYIMLKGTSGEAYNAANEETYISARDMAYYLKVNFAPQINVTVVPTGGMGYAPFTKLRLSTDKLQSLGWKPLIGKREMFERLIKYIA